METRELTIGAFFRKQVQLNIDFIQNKRQDRQNIG
jgi:hypothetical protein